MDTKRFSELVSQALDNLPDEFLDLLENVEIVVEDYPAPRQHRGSNRNELLGLYEGVPLTERDTHYGLVLPDKITIFQKPIESICQTDAEIIDQVEQTVRHEVAHHFGITDEKMDEIEKGWAAKE